MKRFDFLSSVEPARFFVFASVFLYLLFNMVTPPLQAPDELNHFYRTCHVADGHFLPQKEDQRLGGQIPFCFQEFVTPYVFAATNSNYVCDKRELLSAFKDSCRDTSRVFRDFPNTAYYSPVSYLPQALTVFILERFHCNAAVIYYGGRFSAFVFWLISMYVVIRLLPFFKWVFTLIILLPMNLYLANSFSADTVTNCLAFLFIAYVLHLVFREKEISRKDLWMILLLLCLLALAKVVYVGLVLLLLLIPRQKFGTSRRYYLSLLLFFAVSFVPAFLWSRAIMHSYISSSDYNVNYNYMVGLTPCGDYYRQKEYIFQHGTYFFKVIWHSLFDHPSMYLKGLIGVFGQSDIALPIWLYVIAYILLTWLVISEKNDLVFTVRQKVILFSAAAASFVLLLLSQHLIWDCPGEGVVDLLQGRYLTPLFPLVLLLFSNRGLQLKMNPFVIIVPFLIVVYYFSFSGIYKRFFKGSFKETVAFYCDAESTDAKGHFNSSDPEIRPDGGSLRTGDEHRSGKLSALLTPESPYGFTCRFNDLKKGDVVEMEAWEKGNGAILVFSGHGKNCTDVYSTTKEIISRDENGWSKLRTAFTFNQTCDSMHTGFYVWNPGKTNIYIDDVKLSIKKVRRD